MKRKNNHNQALAILIVFGGILFIVGIATKQYAMAISGSLALLVVVIDSCKGGHPL